MRYLFVLFLFLSSCGLVEDLDRRSNECKAKGGAYIYNEGHNSGYYCVKLVESK